jgi:hypothetical protein
MADFNRNNAERARAIGVLQAKFQQFKTDRDTISLPSFFRSEGNPNTPANEEYHAAPKGVFNHIDTTTLQMWAYFAEFIDSLPLT